MTRFAEMEWTAPPKFTPFDPTPLHHFTEVMRRAGRALSGRRNHRAEYDSQWDALHAENDSARIAHERHEARLRDDAIARAVGLMEGRTTRQHRHPYSATADRLKGRHVAARHRTEEQRVDQAMRAGIEEGA